MRYALLVLGLTCAPAFAHDWYDPRCCSGRDCHPVPCDQLSSSADGGQIFTPTGVHFRQPNILPSRDTRCHICVSEPATNTGLGYCAYLVQGF